MKNIRMNRQSGFILPAVIALVLVVGFSGAYFYTKSNARTSHPEVQTETKTESSVKTDNVSKAENTKIPDVKPSQSVQPENVCVNAKQGYEVAIPKGWKVWTTGPGEARIASCSEGLAITIFSPNLYVSDIKNISQINIGVREGLLPLDQYIKAIKSTVKKEENIGGYRYVWTHVDTNQTVLVERDGMIYEIYASPTAVSGLNEFLATLKFTK